MALTAPGQAESQRTEHDTPWWAPLVPLTFCVLFLALEIGLFLVVVPSPEDGLVMFILAIIAAIPFVAPVVAILVGGLGQMLVATLTKIRIKDGVVRGSARNAFLLELDRWDDALAGYRIRPVRIPQRLRERPTMFTVSDGPVLPFGAAEIRLEHPTMPKRSVTLIRENNVPAAEPFPLEAEAARYAAHLALPLAELVEAPEFVYPRAGQMQS